MSQMKRNIQDRMSTIESDVTMPVQFISPKPLQARIKEFFTTNQLSQFMQQENILSELEHFERFLLLVLEVSTDCAPVLKFATFTLLTTADSVRFTRQKVQTSVLFCVFHLCSLNEFGMIETPYAKVKTEKSPAKFSI
jgi:DNA-directed RNA polymerase subunit beta